MIKSKFHLHLGIDIDGVVADFVAAINQWAEDNHGQKQLPATHWDWSDGWDDPTLFSKIMHTPDFWLTLKPYPHALTALSALAGSGFDITFITFRVIEAHDPTVEWLRLFGLHHPVIFSSHKGVDAQSAGINWAIDDLSKTVDEYMDHGVNAYLMDRPWNQESKARRLRGWGEVLDQIENDDRIKENA